MFGISKCTTSREEAIKSADCIRRAAMSTLDNLQAVYGYQSDGLQSEMRRILSLAGEVKRFASDPEIDRIETAFSRNARLRADGENANG